MAQLLRRIQELVRSGQVEISDHGFERLVLRNIDVDDVIEGMSRARLLEDYSQTRDVLRILTEQREADGGIIHVVWELPSADGDVAILVTVIRPLQR